MNRYVVFSITSLTMFCIVACGDVEVTTSSLEPHRAAVAVWDGANSGNEHFFFLPPLVETPTYSGTFDPTLAPVVEICAEANVATDGGCIFSEEEPLVASFSTDAGDASEILRLDLIDEQYIANWHTDNYPVTSGATYHISVEVGATVLGYANVQLVSTGKEMKNVETNEVIALKDGRTLPIKFRIEEGSENLCSTCEYLACGSNHNCVVTELGNVHCWGQNSHFGTYTGQAEDYTAGDAVSVAASLVHTCVLTDSGNVDCYGLNWGQADDYVAGDAVGVAAGYDHTCILTDSGNVDCYGTNRYGQAEDYNGGDAIAVAAGSHHHCVLTGTGNVYCYGHNEFGQAESYTNGDAISVAAGGFFTCVLTNANNVHCFGRNYYGEADDYTMGDAVQIAAGFVHKCVLKASGDVDCHGNDDHGQAEGYRQGDAVGVSAGAFHTCVLTATGNVDCYGQNQWGQAEDYFGGDAQVP